VFALFGALAVLLTATVTLSRATLSEGGGNLKCYDLKGGSQNAHRLTGQHSL
jgi:hypothetical protein